MHETNSVAKNPREALHQQAIRRGLGILELDRVTGMAGAMRSRLMAERLARKTQDGTLGEATEMHEDEELANMDIRVGDTYHMQPPAAAADSGAKRTLWPYVLAAVLAGGGLGVGAMGLMRQPPAADADTQYELQLSTGNTAIGAAE